MRGCFCIGFIGFVLKTFIRVDKFIFPNEYEKKDKMK